MLWSDAVIPKAPATFAFLSPIVFFELQPPTHPLDDGLHAGSLQGVKYAFYIAQTNKNRPAGLRLNDQILIKDSPQHTVRGGEHMSDKAWGLCIQGAAANRPYASPGHPAPTSVSAQQSAPAVSVGASDIGGMVLGPDGPEAPVCARVIAETTEPTKMSKTV
jgi:hypothetical protein